MSDPARRAATVADYLARDENERLELIDGEIVEKERATGEHSSAQVSTPMRLGAHFQRKGGPSGPGGWWFFTELEVQMRGDIFRPDVCGYRRERMPEPPAGRPCTLTPDWVCEILSPSNVRRDRIEKMQAYFKARIPHYWLLDPASGILEVYRWTDLAYALVLSAAREDRVRAEPFDAVELRVAELLGADPEE